VKLSFLTPLLLIPTVLVVSQFTYFAQSQSAPTLRLSDIVRPLDYSADLRITPGQEEFQGSIEIEVTIRDKTREFWLHAKDLKRDEVRVEVAGRSVPATSAAAGEDFIVINPSQALPAGKARVFINYRGSISKSLTDGMFQQREGEDWYVFTKFEPVTTRRAFPCFDEPSFKVPWQLTLHIPAGLKAFSNSPLEERTTEPGGSTRVRFARTRPLPPYLVALAVGPFDVVDTPPVGRQKRPSRIIVPRGRAADAVHAASVTPQLIATLEGYLGIAYPFEKLDQVVVPLTTAWGGIENAGLICYGQFLLAKPGDDTDQRQRTRITTMLHEMSHHWLGALITAGWWDELWLNEGFATWITPKLLDAAHPDWHIRGSIVGGRSSAMWADSMASARKVRQPIETSGDIANAFDGAITYQKGAAILSMFEDYVGEKTFRKALRLYLKRHSWGTACTNDFLVALRSVSNRDLSASVLSFLDQNGVPLLKAGVRCEGGRAWLRLTQERYTPVGSQARTDSIWTLPVCFRWSEGGTERADCVLLTTRTADFPLADARSCPDWVLADAGAIGYYRTSYAGDWFQRLLDGGNSKLSREERLSLVQNLQALVSGARIDPRQAFPLALRLSESDDREIVTAAIRIANGYTAILPDELLPYHQRFLRTWLGKRAHALGWRPKQGESEDVKAIRQAIVPLVAIGGEDQTLGAEAVRLARGWLADRRSIDSEMSGLILIAAARHGDRALFEQYLSELRKSKVVEERFTLVAAIGAFRDPEIARTGLRLLLDDSGLEIRVLTSLLSGQWRENRRIVWDFVRENFDVLNARLPGARGIPFGATLPSVAGGFCEDGSDAEVEAFFRPRIKDLSGGTRNLERVLEGIRLCKARRNAVLEGVREFLSQYEEDK